MDDNKDANLTWRSPAWTIIFATLVLQSCGGSGSGGGSGSAGGSYADSCPGVAVGTQVGAATIEKVEHIAGSNTAPAYCKVSATIAPQAVFELRLPDVWQRRYMHMGGGGFDGRISNYDGNYLGAITALSRGFAVVSSNGGHIGKPT